MIAGQFYEMEYLHHLVYSERISEQRVLSSTFAASFDKGIARRRATYQSGQLGFNVFYIAPRVLFVVLDQHLPFFKILTSNGEAGWVYLPALCSSDVRELNKEQP
jgi:hypothetical protein